MKIYRDLDSIVEVSQTAIALGLFDGVHLGHRSVIKAALLQKENGLTPAVFTFCTHYASPSSKGKLEYICTDEDRLSLFESLGVEIVFMPEFSDIQGVTPEKFVSEILVKKFGAKFVSCGFNFHFGAKGAGNIDILKTECAACGITAEILAPLNRDDVPVSSTIIRGYLREGKIEKANELLGSPYFISGEVVRGNAIGHTIGFPTANQIIKPGRIVPKHGVYATTTTVDGVCYRSVTNIGIKPTISGQREPLSETHIIGFDGELYGKNIRVSFHSFLRPEVKFSGLEALKAQIALDKQNASAGR